MTVVVNGLDDEPEGARTVLDFKCVLHVEETGSDWPNSLQRAKAAFEALKPTEVSLFEWSMTNRLDQRILAMEVALLDDHCRISSSMRSSTVSELVFDLSMTIEAGHDDETADETHEGARDAVQALFTWSASDLAAHSPGNGIVMTSTSVFEAQVVTTLRATPPMVAEQE